MSAKLLEKVERTLERLEQNGARSSADLDALRCTKDWLVQVCEESGQNKAVSLRGMANELDRLADEMEKGRGKKIGKQPRHERQKRRHECQKQRRWVPDPVKESMTAEFEFMRDQCKEEEQRLETVVKLLEKCTKQSGGHRPVNYDTLLPPNVASIAIANCNQSLPDLDLFDGTGTTDVQLDIDEWLACTGDSDDDDDIDELERFGKSDESFLASLRMESNYQKKNMGAELQYVQNVLDHAEAAML